MEPGVWAFFDEERQAICAGAHLLATAEDAENRKQLRAESETNLKNWLCKHAEALTRRKEP